MASRLRSSPPHRKRTVSALFAPRGLALVLGLSCLLSAAPARPALMLADPPFRPKDFTMVKKDGMFHLFYIRRDVTIPMEQSENELGHAVSTDLYSWTQLPTVMHIRSDSWDNLHVWAPSIVERDGVYYMFYTGVSDSAGLWNAWQRTGIATSTDLMTWNRLDAPIYSCVQVPWSWCDSTNVNDGFRDPFVMPDPAVPGRWLMYTSMVPAADTVGMIVGVAASTGDFTQWIDLKPLWITNQAYSYNPIVESPHLFKHGNLWYLFFTTNAGQPISYAISYNPVGELNEWVYKGRLANMLSVDTHTWIASEYFANGTHEYFMFVNYNRIEIYEMVWNPDGTFMLYEPGAFHVSGLNWSAPTATPGDSISFSIAATGWNAQTAHLEAVELLPGGGEAAIPMASLGLPPNVVLSSDTTRFDWVARIRHANGDTTGSVTFVVRTVDHTAFAPPLTVSPPTFRVRGLAWSDNPVTAADPETLSIAAQAWAGESASLQAVEILGGGGEAFLSMAALGLPASVPLTGDTTRVPWVARIRHANGDTAGVMHMVVRTTDLTVDSPDLQIQPRPLKLHSIGWSPDSAGDGDLVTMRIASTDGPGHSIALAAFDVLPGEADAPVPLATLGLPDSVALVGDTTDVPWVARLRHASGDTTTTLTLLVRAQGYNAVYAPLRIDPASFVIHSLDWSAPAAAPGQPETLSIAAHAWGGQSATLEGLEVLATGDTVAVPLESLGLPVSVLLTADTTRVFWTARIHHASGDTTGTLHLLVRTTDRSATAPLLTIGVPASTPDPPDREPVDPSDRRWTVRMLSRPPVGAAAMLITLPGPTPTRIDLFDLQGRRVRNLVDRVLPPGATVVSWDGRNDGGLAMARGVYFAQVVTSRGTLSTRLLLLP